MDATRLVKAPRRIGTPVCVCQKAADELLLTATASSRCVDNKPSPPEYQSALRHANLTPTDAVTLVQGMTLTDHTAVTLRSFSASYNPGLGDEGAVVLAAAFFHHR